jgi:hypothetical protein
MQVHLETPVDLHAAVCLRNARHRQRCVGEAWSLKLLTYLCVQARVAQNRLLVILASLHRLEAVQQQQI